MQLKSIKSRIDGKSLASFGVLIIFSFGTAWFVLGKINYAIEEFENMNSYRIEIIEKNLEE